MSPTTQTPVVRPGRLWWLVAFVAAVRIYGVWAYRNDTSLDVAVTTLMARHIARGERFPVFFYGQEYSGTLESFVGAGLMRLLGPTTLAANLGAALLGVLMLPAVWFLARRLGGRRAAVIAVALMAVGAPKLFPYLVSAQSYAQILALSIAVPAAAARLLQRWEREECPTAGDWFLFGAVAGLGHWTHPLVWSSILGSSAALIRWGRRRLLSTGLAAAALGFGAGSAPWWVWNATHGFASLQGAGAGTWETAGVVLKRLAGTGLIELFALPSGRAWALLPAAAVAAVIGGAVFAAVRDARRAGAAPPALRSTRFLLLGCIAAHVLLLAFSAMAQHRSPGRYLSVAFPAFAVLVGGVAGPGSDRRRWWSWWPVALLFALQVPELPRVRAKARSEQEARRSVAVLRETLRSQGISVVYADLWRHFWLNVALEEEIVFWPLGHAFRHRPYWERAERAERAAVLDGETEVSKLLSASGGACAALRWNDHILHFDFQSPPAAERAIPAIQWQVADGDGADLEALRDRCDGTFWDALAPIGADAVCDVTFDSPRDVCGVRLILSSNDRHFRWRVWGRVESDSEWTPLTDDLTASRLEWSGPRVYAAGRCAPLDARFPTRRLTALRVAVRQHPAAPRPRRIAELQVFEPSERAPAVEERIATLAESLRSAGIQRVWADRWTGYALEKLGFSVEPVEPYASDRRTIPERAPLMRLTPQMALVVRASDAELTIATLSAAGVRARTETIAPWTVFRFDAVVESPPLRWIGIGALRLLP